MAMLRWLVLLVISNYLVSALVASENLDARAAVAEKQQDDWWSEWWRFPHPPPKCWFENSDCLKEVLWHGGAHECRSHLDKTVTKTEAPTTVFTTITSTTTLDKGGSVTETTSVKKTLTTTKYTTRVTTTTSFYTTTSTIDRTSTATSDVTETITSTIQLIPQMKRSQTDSPQCKCWEDYECACNCLGVRPSTKTVTKQSTKYSTIRKTITRTATGQHKTIATVTKTSYAETTVTSTRLSTVHTSSPISTSLFTTTNATTTTSTAVSSTTTDVLPTGDAVYYIEITYPDGSRDDNIFGQVGPDFHGNVTDPDFIYGAPALTSATPFAYDASTGAFYSLGTGPNDDTGDQVVYENVEAGSFLALNYDAATTSTTIFPLSCQINADMTLTCEFSGYTGAAVIQSCNNALFISPPGVLLGCRDGVSIGPLTLTVIPAALS